MVCGELLCDFTCDAFKEIHLQSATHSKHCMLFWHETMWSIGICLAQTFLLHCSLLIVLLLLLLVHLCFDAVTANIQVITEIYLVNFDSNNIKFSVHLICYQIIIASIPLKGATVSFFRLYYFTSFTYFMLIFFAWESEKVQVYLDFFSSE